MTKWLMLFALLTSSLSAFAETAEEEAEKLLVLSGTKEAMEQMKMVMLEQQLRQDPSLEPLKYVMLEFYQKHLSFESLKGEFIDIYTDIFTQDELSQMNAFYETPVGQKMVEVMPSLIIKGGEIGTKRVIDNMQELQDMITQEIERIQLEEKQKMSAPAGT